MPEAYVPPHEKHKNTMPGVFNNFSNKLSEVAYLQDTEGVKRATLRSTSRHVLP